MGTDLPIARPHPEWSVSTSQEWARGPVGEGGHCPPKQGTALIQPNRQEVGVESLVLGKQVRGSAVQSFRPFSCSLVGR